MRLKVGMVVALHLLDHAQNSREPLPMVVYGEVARFDKNSITVHAWTYDDEDEKQLAYCKAKDDNVCSFTILRNACEVEVLKPRAW
jgi:hypothetical protein